MSWLISAALMRDFENSRSLPGPVEEFSAGTCSAGEPSAQWNGPLMPQAYSWPGKTTAGSDLFRYGMTCRPLTEDLGGELLTWFRAAFPVKTSASPAKGPASKAHAAECGSRWTELLARFDPDSSLWKTPQLSLLEDSELSLETWPREGSMRNGVCYRRSNWAFRSVESESGSSRLVPTPTACDHKGSGHLRLERGPNNNLRDFCKINYGLLYPPVKAVEWLMWWPIDHTDLKPQGMDKFHEWQQQHSPRLPQS